jgi:hypothetical protein
MASEILNSICWLGILSVILSFIFGCIFGYAELLSRYSQAGHIFKVKQGVLYIAFNGIVSLLAFVFVNLFNNDNPNWDSFEIEKILIAGFGGMAVLRSTVMSVKVKDKKVDVGINAVAQIFLESTEKKFDTKSAEMKMEEIQKVMDGVIFDSAKLELQSLCSNFMENLSEEDNNQIIKEVDKLSGLDICEQNKSIQLGHILTKWLSIELLKKAIDSLGNNIKTPKDSDNRTSEIDSLLDQL